MNVPAIYNEGQLALIKRTVAKDCNNDEFDVFVATARSLNLDPLRNKIYAFVFQKGKPGKRNMSIVISIDAFRAIAERSGNYAPSDKPARLEVDEALKGPNNPAGLVTATVWVKKFAHGEWHEYPATAYWEEMAPLREAWEYDQDAGKRKPTGRFELDTSGNWAKMPRVMLAKCAEAAALRRGWPEDLSSIYSPEEMDQARVIDITPSEAVDKAHEQVRLEAIGGKDAITVDWMDGTPLDRVKVGDMADRIFQMIDANKDDPGFVLTWQDRNRFALKEFWAKSKTDALAVKRRIEALPVSEMEAAE